MNDKRLDNLLGKIARGDNKAFEELYIETRRGVYSFLYTYFHHKEDTEDAMQTVYLKVKQNIDKYKIGTNGKAWILQIAKNHALNEIKKAGRITYVDNLDYVVDEGKRESNGIMDLMKRVLDDDEQKIVNLHVIWGYKHREIGEILGAPTGTITSKYKRAVAKLKDALKKSDR